jgi:hypothetical protein
LQNRLFGLRNAYPDLLDRFLGYCPAHEEAEIVVYLSLRLAPLPSMISLRRARSAPA